jgi:hypothetical protein
MELTTKTSGIGRREALALLAAAPLLPAVAAVPTDRITVLYKRETASAPGRLDPAVQAAILALENEFLQRRYRVLQPAADVYEVIDQGPSVIVTFAEDAGFSLVFSAHRETRPAPGQEAVVAEVRLAARVMVGRHVLVSDEGRGQMFARTETAREAAERRGLELAARRAAADLAEKAVTRLAMLSAAEIDALVGSRPSTVTTMVVMPTPAPAPTPVAAPPAPVAPSPAPVAAAPAPVAPAPAAPAPAAAPVPVASAGSPLGPPARTWAVVVGMSDYSSVRAAGVSGIKDLPGVARDVRFVVESLGKLGFARERTALLMDANATGAALRGVMKELAAKARGDDAVLLFISAHGANKDFSASGYGMPILADYRPDDPGALDFWELQSLAKNLPGRVIWISDTCHSGGAAANVASVVVSSRGVLAAGEVRGPDAATVARGAGPGQDFAILTASSPNEISWETAEGGLFTTRLFRALIGTNGKVPFAKLFADGVQREVIDTSKEICKRQNACARHPQQTPIMAYGGNGNQIRL